MDVPKYEIHIQSTSKMIEVAKQYGRDEIAEKNQKNLDRLTSIYETIRKGNIVFGRMERIKGKQGVKHVSDYDRRAHLKQVHEARKAKTIQRVDESIRRLVKAKDGINFNSVSTDSGVSKATLYNNPEIRMRIESLRQQQAQVPTPNKSSKKWMKTIRTPSLLR